MACTGLRLYLQRPNILEASNLKKTLQLPRGRCLATILCWIFFQTTGSRGRNRLLQSNWITFVAKSKQTLETLSMSRKFLLEDRLAVFGTSLWMLYRFSVFVSRAMASDGSSRVRTVWEMLLLLFCQFSTLAIFPSLRQIFHQQSKSRKWSPQWGRNGSFWWSPHSSSFSSPSAFSIPQRSTILLIKILF